MSLLSVDGLKTTLRDAVSPTASIYMPTHRTGIQTAQDPIRLENLVKDAGRQLGELGHDGRVIERVLAPARALIRDAGFWPFQSDGLALLLWDGGHAVHRLPIPFAELCVVGDRLHVKPLLPTLSGDGRFFVLALSQNLVRVFDGGREGLRALDTHDIPASLAEVVGYDVEQKSLQFRTQGPKAAAGPGRAAQFHGHGDGSDDQKDEIEKFLRAVDDGVRWLIGLSRAPVVLAAAEPITSMFRRISKLPGLVATGPVGNADNADARTLFDKSWPHVQARFEQRRTKIGDLVRQGLGTGKVVQRIEEVVQAALDGRIEAMLAAKDAFRWGRLGRSAPEVRSERQTGDVDLIDVAAAECLLHGGDVHAISAADLPGDHAVVAAVLRF